MAPECAEEEAVDMESVEHLAHKQLVVEAEHLVDSLQEAKLPPRVRYKQVRQNFGLASQYNHDSKFFPLKGHVAY